MLRTRHFGCSYYLTWFFECYECRDNGWWLARTPDDRPLYYSDAFLCRAMGIIQTTMNLMRKEEMDRPKV